MTATAGQASADVSWTAPGERRPGDVVQGHAVHRRHRADGQDGDRHAAGDEHDDRGPDGRHRVHVHGPRRPTPRARGPIRRRSERRHADWRVGARRAAEDVSVAGDTQVRDRDLDGAHQRPAAARSTGYTVTPFVGSTAQTPVTGRRLGDRDARHRAHQRHELHVPGHRDQRRRLGPAVGPRRRRSPAGVDLRPRDAGDQSTPATRSAVVLGVKFTRRRRRPGHRHPLLQGRREHRNARGQPCGDADGTSCARATFTGETGSGWQTVHVRHAGGDHRRHDLRRGLPRPERPLLGHERGVRETRSTTRRCSALANSASPNGVYAYSAPAVCPTDSWNATNYWVDVLFAPAALMNGRPARRLGVRSSLW